MSLYLVDYENTGVRGIAGIEQLQPMDRLIILYGPKTGSVPFEDMVKITSSPAAVEFVRTTKTAKNYLDFQLTTYLGYLIAQRSDDEYVIVSRDSGFDSCVDFWTERSIRILRVNNLARETGEDNTPKKSGGRAKAAKGTAKEAAAKVKKAQTGDTNESSNQNGSQNGNQNGKKSAAKKNSGQGVKNTEGDVGKKAGRSRKRKEADETAEKPAENEALLTGLSIEDMFSGGYSTLPVPEVESEFMSLPDYLGDLPFEGEPASSQTGRKKQKKDHDKNKKQSNQTGKNEAVSAVQEDGKQPTVPEAIKKRVRNALKAEGLQPGAYRKLYACMLESNDKSTLNTALVHAFGQDTANRYYKQILSAFATWRNLS